MTPGATMKGGKRYRYYINTASMKIGKDACTVSRVPAREIEAVVVAQVRKVLQTPEVMAQAIRDVHHHGATARAKHRWSFLARWRKTAGIELEQEMQQADQSLAIGVQETEIAGAAKSPGQHVLDDQPEEIGAGQRGHFPLVRLGIAIAESHPPVVAGEDVLFTDDAAVQVSAEVDQCLLAGSDRFDVCPPFLWIACRQHRAPGHISTG